MAYAPPRRPSHTRPYEDDIYSGQPPQIHTPQEQALNYPPPPPQQQSSYYRPRGSSNASQRSQHSQHSPYLPPPGQQQLTPYSQHQQSPHLQQQQQVGYFPPGSPRPQTPNQLHPAGAYGQDPFAYRQRRESATSHRSSHSHRSHHSSASRKSEEHWAGRKDGQRATLGDSLFGIWDTLKNLIPANRR